MRVLLDSNFLIDLVRFKVDLEEIYNLIPRNYKLIVLDCVLKEIKRISASKSKQARHARVVLKLLESKKLEVLKSKERSADKALFEVADEDTIIATNDKELRKKLKSKGIKTIYLRAKKHLAIG